MVWIRGVGIILQVATGAVGRRAGELSVDVTLSADHGGVLSRQGKRSQRVVVE